jgi:hypothetical protein
MPLRYSSSGSGLPRGRARQRLTRRPGGRHSASRPRMPGSCRAAAIRGVSGGDGGHPRIRIRRSRQHRGVLDCRRRRRAARPAVRATRLTRLSRESLRRNRRRVVAAGSCSGRRDRAGSPTASMPLRPGRSTRVPPAGPSRSSQRQQRGLTPSLVPHRAGPVGAPGATAAEAPRRGPCERTPGLVRSPVALPPR